MKNEVMQTENTHNFLKYINNLMHLCVGYKNLNLIKIKLVQFSNDLKLH